MNPRRPSRLLGLLAASALGFSPVWLAPSADAAAITCSASAGTLTVQAANYYYDQRWSVEGPSHHLWMHDGAGAVAGDECAVDIRTVNTITINSDDYADDWVIDLGSDWTGLNGTDVLITLPVSQYDTVKLDGSSASSAVTLDYVGSGSTFQFSTDGDLTPDLSFDGQFGPMRSIKGGSSTDVLDLAGMPSQPTTITILGNDGSDTITGSAGFAQIHGGAGDDVIHGGTGADIIDGEDGNDQLFGGDGSDVLHDGDGADVLDGDWADGEDGYADVIDMVWDFGYADQIGDATLSYDSVVFYTDNAPVWASLDGAQNDGAFNEDNLLGAHSVQTFGGDDVIEADGFMAVDTGGGSDTLALGATHQGQINWAAGTGTDTLDASAFQGALNGAFYSGGSQLITEGNAPGNIDGSGWEVVIGGLADDSLGVGCACTIIPGPGDDAINFGAAGTYIAGPAGDGHDTITVDDGVSGVKADYSTRTAALSLTIDGDANDGASGEGDSLDFGITHLVGGTGNDTLAGASAADTLDGFAGDDRLLGRGGNDRLIGDVGNDTLYGGSGSDVLLGQDGADKLYGGDGDDVLRGDDKYGAAGKDSLDGGNGDDDLFGYGGDDLFTEGSSANGSDLIAGGDGSDTASYASRSAALKLSLNGLYDDGASGESDRLGRDVENLTGGKGADTITGSASNNVLTGGSGKDKLYGQDGNDTFQTVDSLADALNGGTGTDRAHRDSIDTTTSVEQRF